MPIRTTHTYAVLELSEAAYQEIREAFERAGYGHAFHDDAEHGKLIDMHGIAVSCEKVAGGPEPTTEAGTPCRRCSECIGEEHHWLEHCEDPDEVETDVEPFVGFICKHCEVRAFQCEQCDGPIFPMTGATACAECTAERGDFEP